MIIGADVDAERCVLCGKTFPRRFGANVCDEHDGLAGILDASKDAASTAAWRPPATERTLERYSDLLPVPPSVLPGDYLRRTPLIGAPRLARELDIATLLVKDDGRNPTGSLKDRSSALAVELAVKIGAREVACASTGNAASSLAAACAAAGLTARLFVPEHVPPAKLAQMLAFGAQVFLVDGNYDDAYYLCEDACREFGWYDRNCAVNPYLVEGKKTCAYEIAEDLGRPGADWLSVAVGDGCTVAAIAGGLATMCAAGIIDRAPRILAVQPAAACAIATAWTSGTETIEPSYGETVAEAVAVGRPRNAVKALRAVRASGGSFWTVTDDEVIRAQSLLATLTGVFAEPAAAAGIAAIAAARKAGVISADDRVVHVVTGTGLKTVDRLRSTAGRAAPVACTLEAVHHAVRHG